MLSEDFYSFSFALFYVCYGPPNLTNMFVAHGKKKMLSNGCFRTYRYFEKTHTEKDECKDNLE